MKILTSITPYVFIGSIILICAIPVITNCGKHNNKEQDDTISIGKPAPTFTLPDQHNVPHSLTQYRGKKVVLYFYPKDGTPGCTKQACSLRDGYKDLTAKNIVVLGISYDTPKRHKEFALQHKIPFTLLSDTTKEVASLYNAKGFFIPKRKTFLIDEQGIIVYIFDNIDVASHAKDILHAFEQANKKV